MSRRVLTHAAFAAAVTATPAAGADLPRGAPIQSTPFNSYDWNGGYAGFTLGYQWGHVTNSGATPAGLAGGVQLGYNWEIGHFVFGVETDLQLSGADDTFAAWKFSNPWFGAVRGRGGLSFSNVLLYLAAGLAYGRGQVSFAGFGESKLHFGWTAGLGIEIGLTPNWSARAEYLFVDLDAKNYALTGLDHGLESSLIRLGINYRF
jgi:outer membrane immunogenic protein